MEFGAVKEEIEDKRFRVQITEQELLCKNQCGFYGTPQWNGLCSRCWRAYQQGEKYAKNRVLLRKESLDEKRKTSEGRTSAIKAFLPRSPSLFSSNQDVPQPSPSASNSNFGLRLLGSDSPGAQQRFLNYVSKTFSPNVAKDVEKQCLSFMDKLSKYYVLSKEEDAQRDEALSEMIQTMYRSMNERISRLKFGSTIEDFKAMDFMIELESYICDHAYSILFCTRIEEESADLNLQERIRSLHWVTFGFLETSLDFTSDKVQYFLDEAVTDIVYLNSHRPVLEKLTCLINCSKNIFEALKESRSGAPASADEFLPVLIFVILKANPPLIQSNLNFISRYALQYRITRGESGYYFTNLCCALQFIQNMNAESLHLTSEEFEAFTNGQRVPPKRSSVSNSTLKSLGGSIKKAEDVAENRDVLVEKADKLEEKINRDCDHFKKAVAEFMEKEDSDEIKEIRSKIKEMSIENGAEMEREVSTASIPSSSRSAFQHATTSSKRPMAREEESAEYEDASDTFNNATNNNIVDAKSDQLLAMASVDLPFEICVIDGFVKSATSVSDESEEATVLERISPQTPSNSNESISSSLSKK